MKEAFDLMKDKIMQDRRIGRSSLEAFLEILNEVEAEYINTSTEHINKSSDCSSRWIPCSERLPEPHRKVFITYKSKNAVGCSMGYISIRDRKWHYHQNGRVKSMVLAWMPLPEPWKGE